MRIPDPELTRTGNQPVTAPDTAASDAIAPERSGFRWVMLAGVSLLYGCFGLLMAATAALVTPIRADLGLSGAAMGTILGAWQFVYLFTAIPAGSLLDRFGLRPCLLAAALILAASAALRALADGYWTLLFAMMIYGVGGPLISIGAPKLVRRWFDDASRGLAMGIYTSSTAIGSILGLTISNAVLMPLVDYRWRTVFLIYAAVLLAAALIWFAIMTRPTSRLGQRRTAGAAMIDSRLVSELVRYPSVRSVLLLAAGVFLFAHSMGAWLPETIHSLGYSLAAAGAWAAVPVAVGIVATLVIPRLAVGPRRVTLFALLCIVGALSLVTLYSESRALMTTSLVLQGISRSCIFPIAMLLLMESRRINSDNMGAAGGLFFTAAQVGGVLGPVLFGVLVDATGDYRYPLWSLAAVCIAMAVWVRRLR